MASVPVLKPAEVCRLLERLGFNAVRQRGSHIQYHRAGRTWHHLPMHKGRNIAPSLLRQIARDIGLTVEELLHNR
jgi:predicted RNA binding protein YcfA (HicA-like mRNA interferase family)